MRRFMDAIKRALGQFDSRGLRYSEAYLRALRPVIAFRSLTEQALFAEQSVIEQVDQGGMIFLFDGHFNHYLEFNAAAVQQATTTQIGNLAYVILNSIHSPEANYAKAWMNYMWKMERDQLIHDHWAAGNSKDN